MKRQPRRQRQRRHLRLFVEALEERHLLATFVVNSTGNEGDSSHIPGICDTELNPFADPPIPASGICTLRAAIDSANVNQGSDTIQFAIPGSGVPTINLSFQLVIDGPVMMDATTQDAGTVELRSSSGVFALQANSSGSTVRGFVINSSANGISISGDNNFIVGNRFGTDSTGMSSLPIAGTAIAVSGNNNTIGGSSPADRNIIASSRGGIDVVGTGGEPTVGTVIRGNYIGTNATGTAALGHVEAGIRVFFSQDTTVEGNLIAASPYGVTVAGNTATGNVITGNLIGTDVTGNVTDPDGTPNNGNELGNGKGILVNDAPAVMIVNNVVAGSTGFGTFVDFGYGIHIANANATGAVLKGNRIGVNADGNAVLGNKADGVYVELASNVTIGGTTAEDRNIISGNGGDGVAIFGIASTPAMNNHVLGNYIGVDITGELDFGNKFRGVHIDSFAASNIVGGDTPATRNIISGNDSDGVIIALAGATENVVKGNYIGTDKDGVSDLGNGGSGIFILEAPRNRVGESAGTSFVRNVIAGNSQHGIRIQGESAFENVIAGNMIGTDKDGTAELPNDRSGVSILNAPRNRIGDVFDGLPSHVNFPGNVIAAKESGVRIEGVPATLNQVLSNLIGVDISGANAWPTVAQIGIYLLDAPNNRIGVPNSPGIEPGGNTISHNNIGIHIQATAATQGTGTLGSFIGGNFIGTDRTGLISLPASDLGNKTTGVLIENSTNNYLGGQPTGLPMLPGNKIAGNGGDGVRVIGDAARGNVIGNNTISTNDLYGIDLGGDGISLGDPLDADTGPNEFQNSPFVSPIVLDDGTDVIVGNLHSKPNNLYRIEFFDAFMAGNDGYGDGDIFLGSQDVTTDDSGNAAISFTRATAPLLGRFITATATDTSGNTSEFSCAAPSAVGDGSVGRGRFFGVTTTADSGPGSLRQAILDANAHPGLDTILFCLGGAGPHTISPLSMLPTIVDPVVIDGTTQLGARCNTGGPEEATNAQLKIELNGANSGTEAHGLNITAGGSTVRGLVINRFSGSGIRIAVNGGNTIECNFVGTDLEGATALGNQLDGVTIQDSPNHVIGGSTAAARNVISGNVTSGIAISGEGATSNTIAGNFIGTNAAGIGAIANKTGVRISDATFNTIGGDQESQRNVISGNMEDGVEIIDTSETAGEAGQNLIVGNRIGTNVKGTAAIANSRGVRILEAIANLVGIAGAGNLISGNIDAGVLIAGADAINNAVRGNMIGTKVTGATALANQFDGIRLGSDARNNIIGGELDGDRNVISGNGRDGINLEGTELFPTTDNVIVGNWIGTDTSGKSPVPNLGSGIQISGFARNNIIGGVGTNSHNVISGNAKQGVAIVGQNAKLNQHVGNLI